MSVRIFSQSLYIHIDFCQAIIQQKWKSYYLMNAQESRQFTDKTVHRHAYRQNWRQFTDRIADRSLTNFILYLYGMSQFSPFIDVK